jgi:CDP-diacylglycerol--glycerol-3-phosphate 3-phosphatidyltransferase
MPSGWTPLPKWAWQSAGWPRSRRPRASSWVITTARGMPTTAHSCHRRAGGRVHAVRRRDNEKGRIGGPQPGPDLTHEVRVAGGIDEGDDHAVAGTVAARRPVERLGPRARLPWPGDHPDEVLEEAGLPDSARPDEDDVADLSTLERTTGAWGGDGGHDALHFSHSSRVAQPLRRGAPRAGAPRRRRSSGHYPGVTMLNRYAGPSSRSSSRPLARLLVRLGVSPDVVTVVGTLGVCAGRCGSIRGASSSSAPSSSPPSSSPTPSTGSWRACPAGPALWGAYSTPPSTGSAMRPSSVAWSSGMPATATHLMAGLALACLILGSVVSYAKARAEGLGMTANVGIAERADRLVAVLVATGLVGLVPAPDRPGHRPGPARGGEPGHRHPAHARQCGQSLAPGVSLREAGSRGARSPWPGSASAWAGCAGCPERAAYASSTRLADLRHLRGGITRRLRANYARVRPDLGPTSSTRSPAGGGPPALLL